MAKDFLLDGFFNLRGNLLQCNDNGKVTQIAVGGNDFGMAAFFAGLGVAILLLGIGAWDFINRKEKKRKRNDMDKIELRPQRPTCKTLCHVDLALIIFICTCSLPKRTVIA